MEPKLVNVLLALSVLTNILLTGIVVDVANDTSIPVSMAVQKQDHFPFSYEDEWPCNPSKTIEECLYHVYKKQLEIEKRLKIRWERRPVSEGYVEVKNEISKPR